MIISIFFSLLNKRLCTNVRFFFKSCKKFQQFTSVTIYCCCPVTYKTISRSMNKKNYSLTRSKDTGLIISHCPVKLGPTTYWLTSSASPLCLLFLIKQGWWPKPVYWHDFIGCVGIKTCHGMKLMPPCQVSTPKMIYSMNKTNIIREGISQQTQLHDIVFTVNQ